MQTRFHISKNLFTTLFAGGAAIGFDIILTDATDEHRF